MINGALRGMNYPYQIGKSIISIYIYTMQSKFI